MSTSRRAAVNTWLDRVARTHIGELAIPKLTLNLLTYVAHYLTRGEGRLGAKYIYLNGSYNSMTAIRGGSDIDLLVVFDQAGISLKELPKIVLALDGALLNICRHDVDGELDFPAFCIRHLSYPQFPIEITPAISTSAAGIFLGREDSPPDYLILGGRFGREVISTNPRQHRLVTTYLNRTTRNQYSKLAVLLKLWRSQTRTPVRSIAIELLLYHAMRGTLTDSQPVAAEILNGSCNVSFPPRIATMDLVESLQFVLREITECLGGFCSNGSLYSTANPFRRISIPDRLEAVFSDTEAQQEALDAMGTLRDCLGAALTDAHSNQSEHPESILGPYFGVTGSV